MEVVVGKLIKISNMILICGGFFIREKTASPFSVKLVEQPQKVTGVYL